MWHLSAKDSVQLLWEQTQTHSETLPREKGEKSLRHTAVCEKFPVNLLHQSSGNPAEEEVERVQEPEGMEDTKRRRFSETTEQGSYEMTETGTARQGHHRSILGSPCAYYSFRISAFMRLLSVWRGRSMVLVPTLRALFLLLDPALMWWLLFSSTRFYFIRCGYYLLEACSKERQKENRSG